MSINFGINGSFGRNYLTHQVNHGPESKKVTDKEMDELCERMKKLSITEVEAIPHTPDFPTSNDWHTGRVSKGKNPLEFVANFEGSSSGVARPQAKKEQEENNPAPAKSSSVEIPSYHQQRKRSPAKGRNPLPRGAQAPKAQGGSVPSYHQKVESSHRKGRNPLNQDEFKKKEEQGFSLEYIDGKLAFRYIYKS